MQYTKLSHLFIYVMFDKLLIQIIQDSELYVYLYRLLEYEENSIKYIDISLK